MSVKQSKGVVIRAAALIILIVLIVSMQTALQHYSGFLHFYIRNIFTPLQQLRSYAFNALSFSLGDIVYLLLLLLLLLITIRLIYFLCTIRKNGYDFKVELLRFLLFPAIVYFLFLLLWGGNYSRQRLSANWDLESLQWDKTALITLNNELVQKMNLEQKTPIVYTNLEGTNKIANALYHACYGDKIAQLKVKPTSLGYMLNYIGVQGYYNPLSGEAQFNRFIPPFMHPFVVSHEMAHQTGIAAEDDANLLAYVLGSESNIAEFRYSAYFNIFIYAYADLKERDSVAAKNVYALLNQQSRNDMDTLRAMNRRYRSSFRRFTNSMYDEYLKLHGQQEGLNTYSDVTRWVYFREHSTQKKADLKVCP